LPKARAAAIENRREDVMAHTWISNLSIRSKLMLTFAVVLSAVLVVSAVALWSLHRLGEHVNVLTAQTLPQQEGVARLGALLQKYRTLQFAHISALGPEEQVPVEAELKAVERDLPKLAGELRLRAANATEQAQFQALADQWKAYQGYFATEVLPISKDSLGTIAVRKMDGDHGKQFVAMQAAAATLSDQTRHWAADITAEALAQRASSQRDMLVASVLAIVAGALAAWFAARALTARIARAVDIAKAVAAGDLTRTVTRESGDEVGQLLTALGDMSASLSRTVGDVREGTEFVAAAAAEIARGNMDLSARTETQAASLQQTTASVRLLSDAVGVNADSAHAASRLAEQASSVAEAGGEAMGEVVTTMQGIDGSSRKIADIISVIDGIAFQTNILALNAAVEAARAGEQGRGFAVVASEVRGLAGRSAEAAKDIKHLIAESVQHVGRGNVLVGKTGVTMGEVVGQVRDVSRRIGEITAASVEQNTGIGQIHQSIALLDRSTQENAALVEQTAAAAENLREQSRKLAQAMAGFKV
jgi:methyl-accepting chemotaxis protein